MIERVRAKPPKKVKADPKRMTFTDLGLERLRPPQEGQATYWDSGTKGQLGLSLLVSAGGTKTFRSTAYLHGRAVSRKLGRFPEMEIPEARELTAEDRRLAAKGIDPRSRNANHSNRFSDVVDQFIERYAKIEQKSWAETKRVLTRNCVAWAHRPIATITKRDAYTLLDGFIADGNGPKAGTTLAWLRKLWRWAFERDIVPAPIMDGVKIKFERKVRDRTYTDAELRAIWKAADTLGPVEGGYVKLAMLLIPRKSALAKTRWSHLDADPPRVWTTPFELTKTRKSAKRKRVYVTPLPLLAQRLFSGLSSAGDVQSDYVFPGRVKGTALSPTGPLKRKLVAAGAPKDFGFHALRHTAATWLQKQGHSEYEIGLVLNHAASGVTAGYMHGTAHDLKLSLLQAWSDHVEQTVAPGGVTLLR